MPAAARPASSPAPRSNGSLFVEVVDLTRTVGTSKVATMHNTPTPAHARGVVAGVESAGFKVRSADDEAQRSGPTTTVDRSRSDATPSRCPAGQCEGQLALFDLPWTARSRSLSAGGQR